MDESPSNHAALHAAWPVTEPDTYYTFASGGLGWNLPASVGIALAERESGRNRPVVAIIGDGSFQYSVQSIWSAAQLRLPILIVVMRNGDYAILKSFAELERTPGVPGLDLPGLDAVSIAKGYGCDAARVDEPRCARASRRGGAGARTCRRSSRCRSRRRSPRSSEERGRQVLSIDSHYLLAARATGLTVDVWHLRGRREHLDDRQRHTAVSCRRCAGA